MRHFLIPALFSSGSSKNYRLLPKELEKSVESCPASLPTPLINFKLWKMDQIK